jgi:SRSO17 transposase
VDLDDGWELRLDEYLPDLVEALRSSGWCGSLEAFWGYCLGVILPGERKSMEPIAARTWTSTPQEFPALTPGHHGGG